MDLCGNQVARKGHTIKLLTSTVDHYTGINLSMAKIISYVPGCYGSWVNWLLLNLSDSDNKQDSPFLTDGSVQSKGHIIFPSDWYSSLDRLNFVNDISSDDICRIHPSDSACEDGGASTVDSIQWAVDNLGKTVYLYPDEKSIVWITNNQVDKIHENNKFHLEYYFSKKYIENDKAFDSKKPFIFKNHNDIIINWPKEWDQNNVLSRWIIREFLSLNIYDAMINSLSIRNIDKIKSLEILPINVTDLRDDFLNTVRVIAEYLEIKINCDNDRLNNLYQLWEDTQIHFYKDLLVSNIVDATINNKEFSWPPLSIVDEAFIQHFLRQYKHEIKCHGLNEFPTNSKKLRELIYVTQ